jgi:hypothetical protein
MLRIYSFILMHLVEDYKVSPPRWSRRERDIWPPQQLAQANLATPSLASLSYRLTKTRKRLGEFDRLY